MADLRDLTQQGKIRRGSFSREQIEDCLAIARRDLVAAREILEASPEWAYNIAYNAMLQAGRALMFHMGYRTSSEGHHTAVVQFLATVLGEAMQPTVTMMDRMRRNRNRATYDKAGTLTRAQASEACEVAASLVEELARLAT